MDSTGISKKELLNESKTKQIWALSSTEVLVVHKDRGSTVANGLRGYRTTLDKSLISTRTTSNVFHILNTAGIKTSFLKQQDTTSFVATRCKMLPIQWAARRMTAGPLLEQIERFRQGIRSHSLRIETRFKDDANHYPQWVDKQILAANFELNGLKIGPGELDIMRETTTAVFQILEAYWATQLYTLVEVRIEFGVSPTGNILIADVIDNDSWEVWHLNDRRLARDIQVYRPLTQVKDCDKAIIKGDYELLAAKLEFLRLIFSNDNCLVVIILNSAKDEAFCKEIGSYCEDLALAYVTRVLPDEHERTKEVIKIIDHYEVLRKNIVFIAVADRSDDLGLIDLHLIVEDNTNHPVINCPPISADSDVPEQIWSKLSLPPGMGCGIVSYPEAVALRACYIFSSKKCKVCWSRLRAKQLNSWINSKLTEQSP